MDFKKLSTDLTDILQKLSISKEEIETIVVTGDDGNKQNKALDAVALLTDKTKELLKNSAIPDDEKKRKRAALESRIQQLKLLQATEKDFEKRIEAERELTRLVAEVGVFDSQDIFHFEDLIDAEGEKLTVLLREAERDISARKDLRRVLKGVEVVMRVVSFSASLAAKIAVAV